MFDFSNPFIFGFIVGAVAAAMVIFAVTKSKDLFVQKVKDAVNEKIDEIKGKIGG